MPSVQNGQPMDTHANRSWPQSLAASALVIALVTIVSAIVNPLLGRTMHWDIAAVLMPVLFFVLTFALRWRWV